MVKNETRVKFLAEKYNVFLDDELNWLINELELNNHNVIKIDSDTSSMTADVTYGVYALLDTFVSKTSIYEGEEVKTLKKTVRVSEGVFSAMVSSDPTPNKIYTQWMLSVYTNLIKNGKYGDAVRFGSEDLPQASLYLELFHKNKRKRLFTELCKTNHILKNLSDPTNINQYSSLSQLFDAVDPFIERDLSSLARNMQKFVDAGQALIPVRDRKFTLFIPLTRDANVLFDGVASWCTCIPGNGMFNSYTSRKTPLNDKSKIYIIINNELLNSVVDINNIPNNMLYQLHFESKQIRDRSNGANKNIYNEIISKSEALSNYFYDELTPLAKNFSGDLSSNYYVDYLIRFGFTNILFDMLDENQPTIRFKKREIPKLPDLSKFRNLNMLFLGETKLTELTPSISKLKKLEVLSLPKNKLITLPSEIGECKNLIFLNLIDNKLKTIPDEIANLDSTNGGSLHRISIRKDDIGDVNYLKLKELLPTVILSDNFS